ncbi:hypothetical protein AAG906_011384 [Vitis piasezkii]
MAVTDKELEEQLVAAGEELLKPLPCVEELLSLLDKLESFLAKVEQSPSKSMQTAVCPAMKALVVKELLNHLDVDVRVVVASCISEITRITAPDAPYDDDQMKEIFELIVATFENLSDTSSRSYPKRVSILETVAKVRSCVVMLDLECDSLIIKMFKHFLGTIRETHSDDVYSSMETIMTLVLEESEEVSPELLAPLLDSLRVGNQDVLLIARKLGKKVIQNCALKLRPYMMQAVEFMGFPLDNYYEIVASICQETSDAIKQNDANVSNECVDAKALAPDVSCSGGRDGTTNTSGKLVTSNGTVQIGISDSLVNPVSPNKGLVQSHQINQSKGNDATIKAEPESDPVDVEKSETKSKQPTKRRGRKSCSSTAKTETSGQSQIDSGKEALELLGPKSCVGEIGSSTSVDPSSNIADVPFQHEKETTQIPSQEAGKNEMPNPLPSLSEGQPDGSASKRSQRRTKKKGSKNQEADLISTSVPMGNLLQDQVEGEVPPSTNVLTKKEFERASDSETKRQKRTGKKALVENNDDEKTSTLGDDAIMKKKESREKQPKKSGKKVGLGVANEDEVSRDDQDGKKNRGRGKSNLKKDLNGELSIKEMFSSAKSNTKSQNKEEGHLLETPRTQSKRKRTPGKEASGSHDDKSPGEELVGSKIKVWWPDDEAFYEGVIDSFDPKESKHKVLYADGDVEVLILKEERYKLVGRNSVKKDGGKSSVLTSPGASTDLHPKKRAKTNSDSLSMEMKSDIASKEVGGTSTGKSKGEAAKSSGKTKRAKAGGKSRDKTPANVRKLAHDNSDKSKGETDKVRSKDSAVRTPRKSKDGSPKTSTKSKDGTPKTAAKTRSKKRNKSNANGSTKASSGSLKALESEETKVGKSSDSTKERQAGTVSGKKRQRRVSG